MATTVIMSRVTEAGVDRAVLTIESKVDLVGARIKLSSVVEVRVNDVLLRAEPCNVTAGVEEMKKAMANLQAEGYELVSIA